MQLHGQNIAHQDLKPSNILRFGSNGVKLGDLGRSTLRGKPAPHDHMVRPGALNYAPFEQRYGHTSPDWTVRRLSTDVFHLGCLVVFVFTNICFPEFVIERLDAPFQPANWGDPYEEVMPHIQDAMTRALYELSEDFPPQFRTELNSIVLDLCNPDPKFRAHAGQKEAPSAGPLWLQRYVSKFDLLEKKAQFGT